MRFLKNSRLFLSATLYRDLIMLALALLLSLLPVLFLHSDPIVQGNPQISQLPLNPMVDYDLLIKNARIYDGSGNPWYSADIGVRGNLIGAIGQLRTATARIIIDAQGLAVSPGFIDMLGDSETALLMDNRSLSKLSQGITTEITGEGITVAPQSQETLRQLDHFFRKWHLRSWTTLEEYFAVLGEKGTPLNLGSYVGATQLRHVVLGDVDRPATPDELAKMKSAVTEAMQDGAFGLSTALIYPPGTYARTEELIELAKVASSYGGIYATHLRSEGQAETPAIAEAIRIGREGNLPVEIFHLKVIGRTRWGSMSHIVAQIESARASGIDIRADMYPYVAGATALSAVLPPWVADGGTSALLGRLGQKRIRRKIRADLRKSNWENLWLDCGGPSGIRISAVEDPQLKKYEGKTIAQIALMQNKKPVDAMLDLLLADKARTYALLFFASEGDMQIALKQPWTSICLDANETSLDGPLFAPHDHPRGFGAMPRFLGHYVRDLKLMKLEEAIRKITSMPAQRERLFNRGMLIPGFYADITIFDPTTINGTATYSAPTRLSTGVKYVVVNGQIEYDNGKITGMRAGQVLRGPGWQPGANAASQ